MLGYPPIYHMREVYKNGHGPNWIAALNAKFANTGTAFGQKDFDDVLMDFAVGLFYFYFSLSYPPYLLILSFTSVGISLCMLTGSLFLLEIFTYSLLSSGYAQV